MMKLSTLKAKIGRNDFIRMAGKYYVDEQTDIVKELNLQGEKALVGIRKKNGIYTIIGEKYIYYLSYSGVSSKIPLGDFMKELAENLMRVGKGYFKLKFFYKKIRLENNHEIWLKDSLTMFALWNTILWLEKLPGSKVD